MTVIILSVIFSTSYYINRENAEGSTHSITVVELFSIFNFQISYKRNLFIYSRSIYIFIVDLFIIKLRELEKLDSNDEHFSSKNVFRQGLYINYIFIFYIGNNCITMSGGFRMVCLEKSILEIALAAINHMKGDNLSKRNE